MQLSVETKTHLEFEEIDKPKPTSEFEEIDKPKSSSKFEEIDKPKPQSEFEIIQLGVETKKQKRRSYHDSFDVGDIQIHVATESVQSHAQQVSDEKIMLVEKKKPFYKKILFCIK
jgi:hypothetical protein